MKIKGKQAISLIVLVITILVLSILAATVIISLSNTNIISQANDAVKKTEAQQIEEAKTLMYAEGMLGYNPEDQVIGDTVLSWDDTSKSVQTKVDTVKIPDGFYYVGGTKETGLVISDNAADANMGVDYTCEGNQFVWVPVEYTATGVTDANGLDTGFTAVFKIYDSEPYTENDWEVEEYNAMCTSVEKYSGFYIARFEAAEENDVIVSKKGLYPLKALWGDSMTEIGTTGAVYLSQNMYNSSSVVSTLCYGNQWEATLNFVEDAEHNINDAHSWGNLYDKETFTSSGLATCGYDEAWKAKNIYDLAGNLEEWTMLPDSYTYGGILNGRHVAGGSYSAAHPIDYAGLMGPYFPQEGDLGLVGFRVTLYLK